MNPINNELAKRQISNWLILGAIMILVQILLGGITRLTEAGLSITEWKPITGTLPPLNHTEWQIEFDKYKNTDQFKYVHRDFSLSDFQFIFFWEWFHRVWARLMGIVFLIGFVYFIATKKFKREMVIPMIILFVLGGLQGVVGWFMVKSGLVPEKYFVGHIELTTHLMMALLLLTYTLWFALKLKIPSHQITKNSGLKNLLILISVILFFQLIYGGFMAGLRTAPMAPTWPDINGYFIPPTISQLSPLVKNIFYNPITIHFIHRGLAYILFVLVIVGWFKSRKVQGNKLFKSLWLFTLISVVTQVLLGILTVVNAPNANRLVWLGVSHQFVGIILVIMVTCLLYVTSRNNTLAK